jgi:uroporphyrinogen-III decarboxylase
MTSRERLQRTLNHEPVDRVCTDFGATAVTGIAASTVSALRTSLLGDPSSRVKVHEPYQMLGEIDDKLREALGIDVVGIMTRKTMFGFENKSWKPFTMFDGTEVLVPGDFNVTADAKGDLLIYPEGDTTVAPSGRMPKDGYYFDAICRQDPIVEEKLDPADNLEEFSLLTAEDLAYYAAAAEKVAKGDMGAILTVPGAAFGDIALVPATWMKRTKGIRDVEEWYVSTVSRRPYVYRVFEGQCEIALKNLERLIATVGDTVQAAFITGTDFGTQNRSFISRKAYRELFQPFHKIINDYIHAHSRWKTFIHSCGSVIDLIPDFIESGFDILNPVQCSAAGMNPEKLKREFGKDLVFWGGGVDTQNTLPFGRPDEVYREVRERIRIFGEGSGFVFNAIHNIQAKVPVENVLAMFRAIRESS